MAAHFNTVSRAKCWEEAALPLPCLLGLCGLAGAGWAWPQLCVQEECVSSTQITPLALTPTLPPSAVTTEWEGNRKTEQILGSATTALSPSWQDFVIQGFLAWSNRLFLAIYVRNQHKEHCTLLTTSPAVSPGCELTPGQASGHPPNPPPLGHARDSPVCRRQPLSPSPHDPANTALGLTGSHNPSVCDAQALEHCKWLTGHISSALLPLLK